MLNLFAIVLGISVPLLFVFWFLPRWQKAQVYIKKVSTCGYLSPPPSKEGYARFKKFCRGFLWWQVGPKITIVGAENLRTPGPKLIAPNHGHFLDPMVFPAVLDEQIRCMAARGVFLGLGGTISLIAGPGGVFAVDLTKGKGGPAKEAAITVLTTGQTLLIFPEGWAWMDGTVEPFKKGTVSICKIAAQRLGKPCFIVPSYMRYGRYPGKWIRKYPPPLQYLYTFLLAPFLYRKGLTLVFGKAISSDELPADDAVATEMLRQAVLSLDPAKVR